jgi:hypothetical protein
MFGPTILIGTERDVPAGSGNSMAFCVVFEDYKKTRLGVLSAAFPMFVPTCLGKMTAFSIKWRCLTWRSNPPEWWTWQKKPVVVF